MLVILHAEFFTLLSFEWGQEIKIDVYMQFYLFIGLSRFQITNICVISCLALRSVSNLFLK